MEATITTEIGMPTLRTDISKETNTQALAKDLDIIDELREAAVVRMASYQQRTTNLYNMRVRQRAYQAGDLVLSQIFEKTANPTAGKFQPNWEGPYTIVKVGPVGCGMLCILRGIINKNSLPLKVLSIKFPLECFLSTLEI